MPLSTYAVQMIGNRWLRNTAGTFPATIYMALLTTAPTALDGSGYVELNPATYPWYGRQAATIGAPSGRTFANSGAVLYSASATVLVPVPVTHAMIVDSATYGAGNVWAWGQLTSPISIGVGSPVNFPIGQLVFNDDGT